VSGGRLSSLQERVLVALADLDPGWTLAGGAALVGFHLRHRTTRDLDLFWRGRESLDRDVRSRVEERLRRVGLESEVAQVTPTLLRLRVHDGGDAVMVDLLAEPSSSLEAPASEEIGGKTIRVDGLHEILVDKLCALLGRAELRDLLDVRGILEAGADLGRALLDAPKRDSGFSPLTFAWVLRGMPLAEMAAVSELAPDESDALDRFRHELIETVARESDPSA
jgi:hypothetical protein